MSDILKQLKSHIRYENRHDVTDAIAVEIVRIQNIGFEEAHKLRECGHSVGDYRDSNYGTDKYDGNESCVGCEPPSKKFTKISDNEWVQPKMKGYLMKCCDCGLVHRLDFRLVKYGSKKHPRNKIQFRVFRETMFVDYKMLIGQISNKSFKYLK